MASFSRLHERPLYETVVLELISDIIVNFRILRGTLGGSRIAALLRKHGENDVIIIERDHI